ncbi:MAG: thymidine phosphorylase, partial [Limnochordales bacterium]
ACGAPVAKMSGRALGHTGGTLDKLESIPGFSVYMTPEQFVDSVNRLKVAVIGQTAAIAPADGKWYKLRDVTATVESVPLIAASIMSKKLAAGADALVLDVKAGRGAFLKKFEDTLKLAETMVSIGTRAGRRTVALITDMNQPLGRAIGNALEVKEAVETLQGRGPDDLTELTLALGTEMLVLAQVAEDATDARRRLGEAIRSGRALEKFREMVVNQGGDPAFIDDPSRLPTAPVRVVVEARASGWVDAIDGHELGDVTMLLGAGRRKQDDEIDHAVGLVLRAKVGSRVEAGDVLCEVHAARPEDAAALTERIRAAFSIGPRPPEPRPLVLRRVSAD